MRTTITLDDRLLAQLKRRAAESGASVSKLVEQAVRLAIRPQRSQAPAQPFELVTFGAGGSFSERNLDKTSALIESDDRERYAPRR